jgi:hypothetical protein
MPNAFTLADARQRLHELVRAIRRGRLDDNEVNRARVAALQAEVAGLEAQANPPPPAPEKPKRAKKSG